MNFVMFSVDSSQNVRFIVWDSDFYLEIIDCLVNLLYTLTREYIALCVIEVGLIDNPICSRFCSGSCSDVALIVYDDLVNLTFDI